MAHCGLQNYTKIKWAFGKGATSAIHLGNEIWPGRNNILFIASDENKEKQLFFCVKELRKQLGREGLKAFAWDLTEVT